MTSKVLNYGIASLLGIAAHQALAGGFQISEKSAASLGRGFAGESAIVDGASTIASNPAGMALLRRPSFSLATSLVQGKLKVDVEEASLEVPGLASLGLQASYPTQGQRSTGNATAGTKLIPAVYAAYPLNETFALGFGAFSNFASESSYDSGFAGSILAETSQVKTINLNPSLSWKLRDGLALGFGVNAVQGSAKLGSANPGVAYVRTPDGLGFATDPVQNELIMAPNGSSLGSVEISGEGWGYGWNVGVMAEPLAGTRVGLAYRSPIGLDLKGDAEFRGTPNVDSFANFAAKAPMELPAIASLSATQELTPDLRLSGDITQTQWSRFEKLEIYRRDTGALSSRVDENWRNSYRYALGLDFAADAQWTLRVGGAYDQTPIPNETRTLRIPTIDLRWYTTGASYKWNDKISFDLGLALIRMSKTGIDDTRSFVGQAFQARLKAASQLEGQVLSSQVNVVL